MALKFWDGSDPARVSPRTVTVSPNGYIYLSAGLMTQVPADCGYFRVAYDAALRLLVLLPQSIAGKDAARGQRDDGSYTRLNVRRAMAYCGIAVDRTVKVEAAYRDGRIEVTLPADAETTKDTKSKGSNTKGQVALRMQVGTTTTGEVIETELVSVDDFCAQRGISHARFYQCDREEFPAFVRTLGKRRLYRKSEVDAWFAHRDAEAQARARVKRKAEPAPPRPAPDRTLLTVVEICARWNKSRSWVNQQVAAGKFPTPAGGRRTAYVYRESEVVKWMAKAAQEKPGAGGGGGPLVRGCFNCQGRCLVTGVSGTVICNTTGSPNFEKPVFDRTLCEKWVQWQAKAGAVVSGSRSRGTADEDG